MPQTFIYVICFALSGLTGIIFPQISRLTDVMVVVCIIGIVCFGIGEAYIDFKKSRQTPPHSPLSHS